MSCSFITVIHVSSSSYCVPTGIQMISKVIITDNGTFKIDVIRSLSARTILDSIQPPIQRDQQMAQPLNLPKLLEKLIVPKVA